MASNGQADKGDEKACDTVMVDPAAESPFALLNQPKVELFDALSAPANSSSKPRFEPKVKPRGPQAKARASKLAPPPPKLDIFQNPDSRGLDNHAKTEPLKSPKDEPQVRLTDPSTGDVSKLKSKPPLEAVHVKTECEATLNLDSAAEGSTHARQNVDTKEFETSRTQEPSVFTEEGGDRVVREIDVFVSRSVPTDTQFYLLQYPLRPAWRPYGLEEQCQEVRVKANLKKLELDLAVDTDSENYDQDALERVKIKTQLHLNPLQAVVQLRPSMRYLDEGDGEKKPADGDEELVDAEVTEAAATELVALQVNVRRRETEWQEEHRLHSHTYLKQLDDAEPWIPLVPHGVDSPVTNDVRRKMMASATTQIPFKLNRDEYVNKLVPSQGVINANEVQSGDGSGSADISRRFLNTLPLEQRFDLLLSKGHVHVLQFESLMNLAPQGCSEQEVLNVLQEKAVLVQGCWVVASSLRYSKPVTTIRDYLLLLFTKNRVVEKSQLERLRISKEILRAILLPFAVQRGVTASWEFQENTDRSFIEDHQAVVKEQAQKWMEVETLLREAVKGLELTGTKGAGSSKIDLSTVKEVPAKKKLHTGGVTKPPPAAGKAKGVHFNLAGDGVHFNGVAGGSGDPGQGSHIVNLPGHGSLSEATLAALPRALNKIFLKHNVCRLEFICRTLRQMAIVAVGGSSKDSLHNPAVEEAKEAAQAAAAPLAELKAAVSAVASNIDGFYFLSTLGNPGLDPFRNVVIALLRTKGPGSGLRKSDIMEASKIALKTEVPHATYQKVLKELCYTKGGAWVLKPGDGRPS